MQDIMQNITQAPINGDLSGKNNGAPFKSSPLNAASIQPASLSVCECVSMCVCDESVDQSETVKMTPELFV